MARTLKQHVGRHGNWRQHNGHTLHSKGKSADSAYPFFITEMIDDVIRCSDTTERQDCDGRKTDDKSNLAALFYTTVLPSSVVKACYRLKSLTDADANAENRHAASSHDAHSCNCHVAIKGGLFIEQHGGNTVQTLTYQTWKAGFEDVKIIVTSLRNTMNRDFTLGLFSEKHAQKNAEADALG